LLVACLALPALACGDGPVVAAPLAGAPPAQPPERPPVPPSILTSGTALSLTELTPDLGSTGGAIWVTLTGTGFQPGSVVTVGGTRVPFYLSQMHAVGTVLSFDTPAHAAEPVDVFVTNPDARTATLAGAFTYAAPDAFDFEGAWSGWQDGDDGTHRVVRFTVHNARLVSLTCDGSVVLPLSDPPAVRNGEFSYAGAGGGVVVSGRIVSASAAVGVISLGPCAATALRVGRGADPA
jgi:hypothetical protein